MFIKKKLVQSKRKKKAELDPAVFTQKIKKCTGWNVSENEERAIFISV